MSVGFWIDLLIALTALSAVLLSLPQVRLRLLRRVKARGLRQRLSTIIERLIGLIAMASHAQEQTISHQGDALGQTIQELDLVLQQDRLLYSEERQQLQGFRKRLSQQLPELHAGLPRGRALEDLILLGQRIVSDLRETMPSEPRR